MGDERDPLDRLAEEFLERLKRGERPPISEFVGRVPEQAADARDLLSALLMVEDLKPQGDESDGQTGRARASGIDAGLEQLGDFRILREIGRGGMGVVYEAEQISLGRRIALKVLSTGLARTPHQVQRFLREARSAAQLHHTNIVPVFGVGEQDGLYFYAMQHISGQGLDKVLEEVKRLKFRGSGSRDGDRSSTRTDPPATRPLAEEPDRPVEVETPLPSGSSAVLHGEPSLMVATDSNRRYARSVARIGVQVAEALEYAHSKGTLHRDIKPSNLLQDGQGTIWVTDFGLAKAAEDDNLTRTGDLVGTLRYMAPERFQGRCDARSDVHALGLTLYELLALRPAFEASDRQKLIYQVTHEEPPRLSMVTPAVPRDLATVVHKAIEKEPGDRYKSARAMADDLRCFLEDRPIEARRVSSTERLTRWARRNPGLATLGSAVAGLLVLTMAVITVAYLSLRRQYADNLSLLSRAVNAEADAVAKLLESSLDHARAGRRSGVAGRRFAGLDALRDAVKLDSRGERRNELRAEAIACLALADLRPARYWDGNSEGGFLGVDFDPVTGRLARGLPGGEVHIYDQEGQAVVARLPGSKPRVAVLRFGPDGRYLAAKHDEGGRVYLAAWDVERQDQVLHVPDGVHASALEIHPDGRTLAAGRRDGSIALYDLPSGRELRRLAPGTIPQTIRFDPTGHRLVVASPNSDEPVQVRDLDTGELLAGWTQPEGALSLDWHPDGRLLAVGGHSGKIHLLDPDDPGRPPRTLEGHDGSVVSLAFHPGGRFLASASWDGTARLWDVRTFREVVKAALPDARILRFSRDGRFLGPGHNGGASWLWEVAEGRECRTLNDAGGRRGRTWSVDFLGGPGVLVSAGSGGIRLDVPDRPAASTFAALPETSGVVVAPDGSFLLTGGASGVLRWRVTRDQERRLRIGPPEPTGIIEGLPTGRIRLSPDGRMLAVVADGERGRVVVVDLEQPTREPVVMAGHRNLERIDLSSDGLWLATGTWKGTGVKIWDVHRGILVRDLPVQGSAEVAFSPDGKLLATGCGTEYVLWDTSSWQPRHRFPRSEAGGLPGEIAFRDDGRVLALMKTRSLVQLIDPETGRELARLEPHDPQPITSLGFSPDGRDLVLTFNAESIQAWDLAEIRQGLASVDLDWDDPVESPSAPPGDFSPVSIAVEPAPWLKPLALSEEHARAGRWEDASTALGDAIDAGARDVGSRARRALFCLAAGDQAEYQEACRELLRLCDKTEPDLKTSNRIAWCCALGPSWLDDNDRVIRLAEAASSGPPEIDRLNTLGAVLYRAGRFEEAIRQLDRSIAIHGAGGTPYDAFFLTMAYHRLGHQSEAQDWLRRASAPGPIAMNKPGASSPSSWIPRIELELLRREATALIETPSP